MNKKYTSVIIVGIVFISLIIIFRHYSRAIAFETYEGMITLKVLDDMGNIVSNANVVAGLSNQLERNKGNTIDIIGETDNQGNFIIKGVSDYEAVYTINKDGYYETSDNYKFSSRSMKRTYEQNKVFPWIRKWEPWNPTITVVLKKKRNPIAMKARYAEIVLPELKEYYPFELNVCDWVYPYGTGKKANIYIYYYQKTSDMFTGKTILRIKTDDDTGIQIAKLDKFSKYQSVYFAPTNNYTNLIEFIVERNRTEVFKDTRLKENQYLIFKIQNSTNSEMYNYGKIYQPFNYGRDRDKNKYVIEFTYYYNQTPDDRNLEFDPQKNLIRTVNRRGKDNSDRFDP